jgi:hypothetical protein
VPWPISRQPLGQIASSGCDSYTVSVLTDIFIYLVLGFA